MTSETSFNPNYFFLLKEKNKIQLWFNNLGFFWIFLVLLLNENISCLLSSSSEEACGSHPTGWEQQNLLLESPSGNRGKGRKDQLACSSCSCYFQLYIHPPAQHPNRQLPILLPTHTGLSYKRPEGCLQGFWSHRSLFWHLQTKHCASREERGKPYPPPCKGLRDLSHQMVFLPFCGS